ncbi:hypothetical protein D3C79_991940 [compost metagenome]
MIRIYFSGDTRIILFPFSLVNKKPAEAGFKVARVKLYTLRRVLFVALPLLSSWLDTLYELQTIQSESAE